MFVVDSSTHYFHCTFQERYVVCVITMLSMMSPVLFGKLMSSLSHDDDTSPEDVMFNLIYILTNCHAHMPPDWIVMTLVLDSCV